MTTATIDIDTLNDLFENQKKLDDIFSSIFDDDSFLSSSVTYDDQPTGSSGQKSSQDLHSNEDLSLYAEDKTFVQKKRSITYLVMPVVVEITVIYYGMMYFN